MRSGAAHQRAPLCSRAQRARPTCSACTATCCPASRDRKLVLGRHATPYCRPHPPALVRRRRVLLGRTCLRWWRTGSGPFDLPRHLPDGRVSQKALIASLRNARRGSFGPIPQQRLKKAQRRHTVVRSADSPGCGPQSTGADRHYGAKSAMMRMRALLRSSDHDARGVTGQRGPAPQRPTVRTERFAPP